MTTEFNLLDEPWIEVVCQDCSVKEVSLIDALVNAPLYRDLAGELRAQDVAVLRLLLAILHSVYSRVDMNGDPDPVKDESDALKRWAELWQDGKFRREPIVRYLEKYRDRFYLFHPDHPFWQIPEAVTGTEYKASKLNGELSESSNKPRFFAMRTGELRDILTFSEAARWLLYTNAFDDTSAKPKGKGLPSMSTGWLGQLGLVTVVGSNLFETLMLNFTLLKDGVEMWGENKPVWETEPRKAERTEIPVPDNQAELLTLQSRRLLLKRDGDFVTGYYDLGGDFFDPEDAFVEQMTAWREIRNNKAGTGHFRPKKHDADRKIWRDFAGLLVQGSGRHIPGVVAWIRRLQESGILSGNMCQCLRTVSVQYGGSLKSFITDGFGDSFSFTGSLLTSKGEEWQELISKEIEKCEKTGFYLGLLAKDLARAAGGSSGQEDSGSAQAKQDFFCRIDIPFRHWLLSVNADQDASERSDKLAEWDETAIDIAMELGYGMTEKCGSAAFCGREDPDSGQYCSSPGALVRFRYRMNKLEGSIPYVAEVIPVLEKEVKDFTAKKLNRLIHEDERDRKADLAKLRRAAGHDPGADPMLWGELFSDMPEDMYGRDGEPSPAEWAVYASLTLFAWHQQGKDCGHECMYRRGNGFGKAMAGLIGNSDDRNRVIRRFNTVAMSSGMPEMIHNLRSAVQLLSSKSIPLDYADLAADLYGFQNEDRRNRIRFKWGQDFYRVQDVSL